MSDLACKVRADWLRDGLSVTSVMLDEVRPALRNELPDEFVTFLTEAGTAEDMDGKHFRFWPPKEWIHLVEAGSNDRLLVFADYLIDSHRFGIWISGEQRGNVSLVTNDPQPPLGSFTHFLRLYLRDDRALYG